MQPEIKCIQIDNEISLALESAPPAGDGENAEILHSHGQSPFDPTSV